MDQEILSTGELLLKKVKLNFGYEWTLCEDEIRLVHKKIRLIVKVDLDSKIGKINTVHVMDNKSGYSGPCKSDEETLKTIEYCLKRYLKLEDKQTTIFEF